VLAGNGGDVITIPKAYGCPTGKTRKIVLTTTWKNITSSRNCFQQRKKLFWGYKRLGMFECISIYGFLSILFTVAVREVMAFVTAFAIMGPIFAIFKPI
jgi:hypothetical protein